MSHDNLQVLITISVSMMFMPCAQCERQRARARALADDAQSNDLQKRRSRQDLEVLILQSR